RSVWWRSGWVTWRRKEASDEASGSLGRLVLGGVFRRLGAQLRSLSHVAAGGALHLHGLLSGLPCYRGTRMHDVSFSWSTFSSHGSSRLLSLTGFGSPRPGRPATGRQRASDRGARPAHEQRWAWPGPRSSPAWGSCPDRRALRAG